MRIFWISGLCLMLSLSVEAASPSSLTFVERDGTETHLWADGLELSYNEGMITARNGEISKAFEVSSLARMFFSDTPQGVETVDSESSSVLAVYTSGGILIGEYGSVKAMMETLEPGIYIVRTGKNVKKIIIGNERNK